MSPVISIQGEQVEKMLQWIAWADNDYIAARQLLLVDALVQGSILSNTTIEKYLKALFVLLALKNPRIHKIDKLYENIKKKGLKLKISEEYLALLSKSYRLRYFDDLEPGFNIALNRTQLLVELDYTVYEIRKGFNSKQFGGKIKTRFEELQEEKNPALLDKNCYFGNYDKETLFEEQSSCYDLWVTEQDIFEAYYLTNDNVKDNVNKLG